MADLKCEIIEHIVVLSQSSNGWTKELNLTSGNGSKLMYDIREWAPNHEKMGEGITLSTEEVDKLKEILKGISNSY